MTVAEITVDDGIVDALRQQLAQLQEQVRARELADLQLTQGVGEGRNIPVIADIISRQKREIILDRLRGVEHVLLNAVKFFDGGLDNGWLQMDMSYADAWENTVCNIHNCSSILEDVGSLVRESSGRNIETSAEEIEVPISAHILFHVSTSACIMVSREAHQRLRLQQRKFKRFVSN